MKSVHRDTFVFAGGGTGGHLFPGIAVAAELRACDEHARIVFAGSSRSVEREILASTGFEHCQQDAQPLSVLRKNPWRFALHNWHAFRAAIAMLRRERPAAVIGLGGFASVPLVLAARQLAIPTVLLEQNVIPGRATRWLSRRALLVCVSFDETKKLLAARGRVVVTGNPVRREISAIDNGAQLSVPDASRGTTENTFSKSLLVLGGSQGARGVNVAVLAALEKLRSRLAGWSIVHQTGRHDAADVASAYRRFGIDAEVSPFFTDMAARYASATLVISRAGATTLAELACAGRPAILIPYPGSVGDHQLHNARACESAGAACVVEENEREGAPGFALVRALEKLLLDRFVRDAMGRAMRTLARPNAAETVADKILQIARRLPAKQPIAKARCCG